MPTNSNSSESRGYFAKRQHLIYYAYVKMIVRGIAADARSMIDVGSADTSCLEDFEWVEHRDALDIRRPYSSSSVRGITSDFLKFQPERRYDLALCLQVLEHIPNARAFAQKLFDVASAVLISVPFEWPEGATTSHIHDPVDMEKLQSWSGRAPSYSTIVAEPLTRGGKGRRLIAYYHPLGEAFSLSTARHRLRGELSSQ